MPIPFSPPDITQAEIEAVLEVLKSGWLTTGQKVAQFEKEMAAYCGVGQAVAVSSATAGMELVLKLLDIRGDKGDEVITTPYTYAATANVIIHRGIRPTFADVKKDSFMLDAQQLYEAITPRTRAIFSVDVGGLPADYDEIRAVLKSKGREDVVLISDSAHSFGARYKGKPVGGQYPFHVFSFHAVKNLTTAEGGAITFDDNTFAGHEDLRKEFAYTALNGQSKDAFSKMQAGQWQYDILTDGLKCNMTDISAAIGLVQLRRYDAMLARRKEIFQVYRQALRDKEWAILPEEGRKEEGTETSYHLFLLRIAGYGEEQRNGLIEFLAVRGIATNVHYKPLPMFTYFRGLGYRIEEYPNAFQQYVNEITLPVYSTLSPEDAEYLIQELIAYVEGRGGKK